MAALVADFAVKCFDYYLFSIQYCFMEASPLRITRIVLSKRVFPSSYASSNSVCKVATICPPRSSDSDLEVRQQEQFYCHGLRQHSKFFIQSAILIFCHYSSAITVFHFISLHPRLAMRNESVRMCQDGLPF